MLAQVLMDFVPWPTNVRAQELAHWPKVFVEPFAHAVSAPKHGFPIKYLRYPFLREGLREPTLGLSTIALAMSERMESFHFLATEKATNEVLIRVISML